MKTCTFIFSICVLVLFPHGLFSKSLTDKEQFSTDSENSNENSQVDAGNGDVAFHDSFRPRHKYKANGRQSRVARSENDNGKEVESKVPQCAVMYKDNEPVGILQPFKDSYRFLPVSGDTTLVDINPIPVKRKTFMDVLYPNKMNEDYGEEPAENTNQFADDRYPSIFAKFKIDSRLDKNLNPDLNMKRSMYKRDTERPDISDEQVSSLKTTLSKMKGDNSAVVEEELKNILDDMGLIDDYDDKEEAKREVDEDENMEQGTNKINLIKEEHNDTRNKRGDNDTTNAPNTKVTSSSTVPTSIIAPTKVQFEEEHTEEAESIDLFKADDAKVIDDSEKGDQEVSTEVESEDLRRKRQFEDPNAKEGETKEGDSINDKRDVTDGVPDLNMNNSGLVKESELNQYEKRVEREIRDKIQKLKQEVKEEIKNLKNNNNVAGEESDTKRKKRQVVNTLIEEENRNIDPNFNDEEQHPAHHVRRKRSLSSIDKESVTESSNMDRDHDKKQHIEMKHLNSNDTIHINNSAMGDGINQSSDAIKEFFLGTKQKIYDDIDGLRFVISFVGIDPKIVDEVTSNLTDNEYERTIDQKREINEEDTVNATFKTTYVNNDTLIILEETKNELQNDWNQNTFANNTIGEDKIGNAPEKRNATHALSCGDNSCSICHRSYRNKKELQARNRMQRLALKSARSKRKEKFRKFTLNNTKEFQLEKSLDEANKKKNIIDILNVIGKKKIDMENSSESNLKDVNSTEFEAASQTPDSLITQTDKESTIDQNNNLSKTSESKIEKTSDIVVFPKDLSRLKKFALPSTKNTVTSNSTITKTDETITGYDEDETTLLKQFHSNDTVETYEEALMAEESNIEKRFNGINPILENTTSLTHKSYKSRNLKHIKEPVVINAKSFDGSELGNVGTIKFVGQKPFVEDITNSIRDRRGRNLKQLNEERIKINEELHDGEVVKEIENIGEMERSYDINSILQEIPNVTDHYISSNSKQLGEDGIQQSLEDGMHVRVERFEEIDVGTGNKSESHVRKRRQAAEDSEENAYQYDDPQVNEEAVNENQSYYDEPYASEENVAVAKGGDMFTSNMKSNCNCDKNGNNCRCGAQKMELSVPNINQESSSDYVDGPNGVVEKKSVGQHCNCDKNGKHCKCQNFDQDSQYSDYAEDKKSANSDDDGVADDFPTKMGERVPRNPRQKRRRNEDLIEDSNADDEAEDDYENYETSGNRLMKREAKPRKLGRSQQFHNGEYFVDLHPDVYRLTPVETSRRKRENFKDLVAIHGGGPVVNHLVAIKQRSMLPHSRTRRRVQNDDNREPRQLIDMSDEDLFGALPQSFAGELARYKRVKRAKTGK